MTDGKDPSRPIALVVEDDQDQRALAAALIEETELAVVECASAEAALGVADTAGEAVVMVLTDLHLAGAMDGIELAQRLRSQCPNASVVVTSGNPGRRLAELPDGAMFMHKPWRALDLLRIAERVQAAA